MRSGGVEGGEPSSQVKGSALAGTGAAPQKHRFSGASEMSYDPQQGRANPKKEPPPNTR